MIIPTLNESKVIYHTLDNLVSQQKPSEVIVVDGGSSDRTAQIASEFTTVVRSARGRARQMNLGAEQASGDFFLFLHADTILPRDGITLIRKAVESGAEAGRFRMRFDHEHPILRLFESYTRFHMFSYGDQGFFVSRELFSRLKGFKTDVPFEDLDFYKRLRQRVKPVILKEAVTTSARRFTGTGIIKQKFINFMLVGLYHLGVDIEPLKNRLYPDVR